MKNTIMTASIFDATCKALVKDVIAHFHNLHTMHRRVLNLKDGYYLSIVTGSHSYKAVEVALMKDGYFIKHPTDTDWGSADDFSICDYVTVESFMMVLWELHDILTTQPDRPIPLIWADLWSL